MKSVDKRIASPYINRIGRGNMLKCVTIGSLTYCLSYSHPPENSQWYPIGHTQYEVAESEMHGDTMTVTSTADFMYYPFGKFYAESSFEKSLRSVGFKNIDTLKIEKEGLSVYSSFSGKDFVRYFQINRVGDTAVEIFSAEWESKKPKLVNGIKNGLAKQKVFEIYFSNASAKHYQHINVLEMVSGLSGIWHFYTFRGDRLVKIEMYSDYKVGIEK